MKKFSVLVVDDSRVSRAMMAGILANTNFEICEYAKNSMEAVEKYSALRPDIVTMDMNLPDANGIECSRRIFSINPSARIIMISAMKDASLIMQGRDVGICSFLQKPVNANELIEVMKVVCQKNNSSAIALQDSYVKPFVKVLQKNLFSLVGLHSKVHTEIDESEFLEVDGIAVIIGLTGHPLGRAILHMDADTMRKFARGIIGLQPDEELADEDISDSVEEAANIIVGRGVSMINDVLKDKEMRITPPGTICGHQIRIANAKLLSFNITAKTNWGDFKLNIGFAEGE